MVALFLTNYLNDNLTPIFKTGEDNDANNYRSISLLSNFNRIFEKIMYNRMKDYIDKQSYCIPPSTVFVKVTRLNMRY